MLRALVYIVPLALVLYALIDLSRSEPVERAGLSRIAWVAIVVLLPVIGPIVWIVVSRSRRSPGGRPTPPASGNPLRPAPGRRPEPRRRSGPVAPDDDPDFLWRLEQQRRRERNAGGTGDPAGPGTGASAPDASGTEPAPSAEHGSSPEHGSSTEKGAGTDQGSAKDQDDGPDDPDVDGGAQRA